MRVVVTGATGNVGTSLIDALAHDERVGSVVGLARRMPDERRPGVEWIAADIATAELQPIFQGADAVIHLAWLIQPSHDPAAMRAVNVTGSARVFHAAGAAGVKRLVHASSVGVYSPGPKTERVDEGWATDGIETSAYSRQKVEAERALDRIEREFTDMRVVRLRTGLIFKREAAAEIRRYFAGPLLPNRLVRPGLFPVVPDLDRLAFQAVHSRDVGEAYRLAATTPRAQGAYNVAAEPVIDGKVLAGVLRARRTRLPRALVRGAVNLSWRLRLQPTHSSVARSGARLAADGRHPRARRARLPATLVKR